MTKLRDGRDTPEQRFDRLYQETSDAVLAYLVRRSRTTEDAADALAETYTAAWRKLDRLPAGDQARLWLFGAARNELHRTARTRRADDDLDAMLANDPRPLLGDGPEADDDNHEILDALGTLSRLDQEIVTLTAWEELSPREIEPSSAFRPTWCGFAFIEREPKFRPCSRTSRACACVIFPASRRPDKPNHPVPSTHRVARVVHA